MSNPTNYKQVLVNSVSDVISALLDDEDKQHGIFEFRNKIKTHYESLSEEERKKFLDELWDIMNVMTEAGNKAVQEDLKKLQEGI